MKENFSDEEAVDTLSEAADALSSSQMIGKKRTPAERSDKDDI